MTDRAQMHQQFDPLAQDSGAGPPASQIHTDRSFDPRTSLEDYNRTMLEYTQRQMSTFVDLDNTRLDGTSSRSSQSSGNSGNSGTSSNGVLASKANGPPPTSAGSSADAKRFKTSRTSSNHVRTGY
ncbi:hypothetical protein N7488_001667 [Penicillium malachiteum]|nr:hypothetical protein N7488_001667 [Penicillium malachiteum]